MKHKKHHTQSLLFSFTSAHFWLLSSGCDRLPLRRIMVKAYKSAKERPSVWSSCMISACLMWMILEYFITYDRNIGQVKPSAGPCWHLQSPPRAWHMVCTLETNWVVMQGKQVATLSFEILLHLFCLNICVDWSRLQIQSRSKNINEIARPQVFLKLLASVKFRLWQWHSWHRKQVMSVIAMLCQSVTRCIFLQADLCTFTLFFLKIEQAKTASFPTSGAVQSEWKMVETHRKRSTQQGAGVLWTNQLYSTILIENTVQSVAKHKVCLFEVSSI